MKFFTLPHLASVLFFTLSFTLVAHTPTFNYHSKDYSVNIEFVYDNYTPKSILEGDSITEAMISSGVRLDSLAYFFGISKSINSSDTKESYHFYNSLALLHDFHYSFSLLLSLNMDLNTLKEINTSLSVGFLGNFFQIDEFSHISYTALLELYFGDIESPDLYDKILKFSIQFPLYYFHLGFGYQYHLDTPTRSYHIYFNINDILEKRFN